MPAEQTYRSPARNATLLAVSILVAGCVHRARSLASTGPPTPPMHLEAFPDRMTRACTARPRHWLTRGADSSDHAALDRSYRVWWWANSPGIEACLSARGFPNEDIDHVFQIHFDARGRTIRVDDRGRDADGALSACLARTLHSEATSVPLAAPQGLLVEQALVIEAPRVIGMIRIRWNGSAADVQVENTPGCGSAAARLESAGEAIAACVGPRTLGEQFVLRGAWLVDRGSAAPVDSTATGPRPTVAACIQTSLATAFGDTRATISVTLSHRALR